MNGFILQILYGTLTTFELAFCALCLGLLIGLLGALLESIPNIWLRLFTSSIIFIVRGLPELLVLFFIYFGVAAILRFIFDRYIDVSSFMAGVISLGLIFGAYASQVFRGAFLAIDRGQIDAGKAIGFSPWQLLIRIQIPQAWRHALPGLGSLWLILLKDTAIVSLIGLSEIMNQTKMSASTTHKPFTFYLIAAAIYLMITSISYRVIHHFTLQANRYLHS